MINPSITEKEREEWSEGEVAIGFQLIVGGWHGLVVDETHRSLADAEARLKELQSAEQIPIQGLTDIRLLLADTYGARALRCGKSSRKARKLLRKGLVKPNQIVSSCLDPRRPEFTKN